MKTSLISGAAVAILGLPFASLVGQTQTSETASSGYIQTSKIVGTKVRTAQGDEIGVVKDVVIDRSTGCMAYTVLSAGGTGTRTTSQAKLVAVPWTVYTTTSEPGTLVVSVERDRIYNAPAFEYARINEYSTSGYINNVYSYYGVSGQVGVSGQTSVTGTAATAGRTTETATATVAPMATAASPAVTAAPSATASATTSASPAATSSPRATRGKTREESPAGKPRETETPASQRRHTEKMTSPTDEEATSESNASPSKERSRHRATKERPEPGTTTTPEQQ